nr:type I restriction endonuclease subunit R [Cyanobacterium aponinum]
MIDPKLKEAGWGVVADSAVKREVIAPGRLLGGGKRAKPLIADYVLVYRNQKLAVIEAKKRDLPDTEGLQQAKEYAQRLETPFTYSTNGLHIYQVDMRTAQEGYIDHFPSPEELWQRIHAIDNQWLDRFADIPFEDKSGTWQPRYYQHNAINAILNKIAQGEGRILLTLATGTGKTAIAFQIAWKLFHSRWNLSGKPTRRPRILFLADRNILADQAFNAFSAFPQDALVRIEPSQIKKQGRIPKNGSIFFTIFQTFMTKSVNEDEEESAETLPLTREFDSEESERKLNPNGNSISNTIPEPEAFRFYDYPPDFFDLIIIDECHRGGAKDESRWRGILEYFSPAVQLGLTATPKRDNNTDTYSYFGEPVYTYALKDGINDGYLTPFKVKQIETTFDEYVYNEEDIILAGQIDKDKTYTEADFNRIIEMRPREAFRIKLLLEAISPDEKTLVFCASQRHALMIRDLVNQMSSSNNPNYCVRVTADDGELGEQMLRAFQDNEKTIPTILTTSRKLSTGVDARNVRNIVLLRPINSMIEFKQIIGRGTRLYDSKDYFTIYDFVRAYKLFQDPLWDGEPEAPTPITPRKNNDSQPINQDTQTSNNDSSDSTPSKIIIQLGDGREREIESRQQTSFWSPDGLPISATEFIERLYGDIPELFTDEDQLRLLWSRPDTRKSLLDGLAQKGYGDEQLTEVSRIIDAEKSDIYDVLAYIAYAHKPITRQERVIKHQHLIFSRYTGKQQEFLDFVLNHYIVEGVTELDQSKLPQLLELKYHNLNDAIASLGSVPEIKKVFIEFQQYLYVNKQDVA